jgi:parallel beta-helix repeat protein
MANKLLHGVTVLIGCVGSGGVALADTLLVDDDRMQCSRAQYTSIQDAVDAAASGDTIRVCAGTYAGTLVIDKTLNVRGARAGKDARKRKVVEAKESILTGKAGEQVLLVADGVVLDGFLVRVPFNDGFAGVSTVPNSSGWRIQNNVFDDTGLFVFSSGLVQSVIKRNSFHRSEVGFDDALVGFIARNVVIESNRFDQADMFFHHSAVLDVKKNTTTGRSTWSFVRASELHIHDNKFEDLGQSPAMLFAVVANGFVENNRVRGGWYGFVVHGGNADLVLFDNKVEGCVGAGVVLAWNEDAASGVTVDQNEIEECHDGIILQGTVRNVIRDNDIEDNERAGIEVTEIFPLFGETGDNLFVGNEVRGNGLIDCQDLSIGNRTAGTDDTWIDNEGSRSSPRPLCVDHVDR